MKKKSTSKSAFFNLRVLGGVLIGSIGILLAVLAIGAVTNAPRADAQGANGAARLTRTVDDTDPQLRRKRQQFLESFFGGGPGGVSPSEYAAAFAAARALPPSPLLQRQKFVPQTPQAGWTFPISPPITNSYGADATAQVHSIAIDPSNTNVVYTGSFGGLAKTTDGGSTWQYLSNAWQSQSVTAIAIDYNAHFPGSNNYIYVGTGRDDYGNNLYGVGLYRSFDGGATWSGPLGGGNTIFGGTSIAAIATLGSGSQSNATLYLANMWPLYDYFGSHTTGLWRSTDSGASWTLLRPRGDAYGAGIYDVAIDLSGAIYIAEDDGAFKSTDAGQNWINIHDCARNANGNCVLGTHDRLSVVNYHLSPNLYLMQPGDPNHNFFESTDNGSSWTQIQEVCPPGASSCGGTQIGFQVFAVDPINPKIIVAGGNGGVPYGTGTIALFRTADQGANWTEVGPWYGPIHADHHAIAFSPTGSVVYDGNDGGIIKSTDTGSTWTNLNHNFPGALMYSVALSANGSMISGTQDNGPVYSNLGAPWNAIDGGDSSHDLIDPVGSTWAYYEIYDIRTISRYNRATGEITDIHPTQLEGDRACSFFPAFSMNLSSPTHLVAGCQQLARTLDSTASPVVWTTIGPLVVGGYTTITDAKQAPTDSNVIYVIGTPYDVPYYSSSVYLTTTANSGNGATWSNITPPSAGHLQAVTVDPTNAGTAYVAGTKGIYKTTNSGTSWSQIGTPNLVYHDVAIEPTGPNWIYAASNAGVFSSTDGGLSWANMSSGIPAGMAVTSLSLNRRNRSFSLAASTYGRGVYGILLPAPR